MRRLPISGASSAGGELTRANLSDALERLRVGHAFDDVALDDLYSELGQITGSWLAIEQSKEAAPVRSALRKLGKDLVAAAQLLSGNETGIRTTAEIFATRLTKDVLALDPTMETDAGEFLVKFRRDAARVGHACHIAAADLSRKSDLKGKEKLSWYDDFTKLLRSIAERAKVRPTLGYDPESNIHCGWLLDAAQEMEAFLAPKMRSPKIRSCGRRLERSLKRLGQQQPQKSVRAK